MPAPPPPPPMAPAAPPPPLMKVSKSSANERDALLKSIRKGAKLKKTVTNDRSAPAVPGTPSSRPAPKNFNNNQMSRSTVSPMRELTLQEELKKQLANDNRNRGPPPPTPNRNLPGSNFPKQSFSPRENVANGLNLSQLALNVNNLHVNPSTLHRKAKSNVNLNTMEISDSNSKSNGFQYSKPVINHGKPNLAPKPPVINGKPLLNPNKPTLNRAQSMKTAPRTPSPQNPVEATNAAIKFGTVRHMSSIIGQSLASTGGQSLVNSAQHSRSRPALNGRPTAPPPSIPQPHSPYLPPSPSQPPPPPSKTNFVKHPNHAPPPPPPLASLPQAPPHAPPPPPPPHKTQISRQPPAIPSPVGSNSPINPPPPPPRNSSMREGNAPSSLCVDLEEKFKHLFQSPDRFPLPPPYRNVIKVYNNKPNMQKPGVV